jgi:hypothetical protein
MGQSHQGSALCHNSNSGINGNMRASLELPSKKENNFQKINKQS